MNKMYQHNIIAKVDKRPTCYRHCCSFKLAILERMWLAAYFTRNNLSSPPAE